MAGTSVLKLKVDDKEYNSSLKQAQQGMQRLEQALNDAGKSFKQVDKSVVDYVRGIGQMEAQSKTARGRISEMSNAFVELSLQYKNMSDEVKSSDVGKALAESMVQLKQRTVNAKSELEGLNKELNNVKSPDVKGSGLLSGLGDKMGGALQVFAGNMLTKAAGAVANLGSEMYGMVQQGIELAKQGEGIRVAFERLGRGDILDGLRQATHGTVTDIELMKAAVKFNDFKLPLEELGTMLAFAQQKAKDTGQSVDYMVDSIVTGLGRKSLMILDNLGLSANEVKEKMKQTGDMTTAVGAIIREPMSKAGDYVETAADRAEQANVSLQNKMEELGRKFAPVEEASTQLWTSMKIAILDVVAGPLARLLNGLTEAGRLKNQLDKMNGRGSDGRTHTERVLDMLRDYSGDKQGLANRQVARYNELEANAWKQANRLREEYKGLKKLQDQGQYQGAAAKKVTDKLRELEQAENTAKSYQIMRANYIAGAKDILNPGGGNNTVISIGGGGGGGHTGGGTNPVEGSIDWQAKKVQDLQKAWRAAANDDSRRKIKAELDAQQNILEKMEGNQKSVLTQSTSRTELQVLQDQLRTVKEFQGAYGKATEEWKEAQKEINDITNQIIALNDNTLDIFNKPASVTADSVKSATTISKKDLEGLQLSYDRATSTTSLEDNIGVAQDIISGMSQVASGLQQMGVQLPEGVQKIIGFGQGLLSVIQGVKAVYDIFNTITATTQIASETANTTAMVGLTAAVIANTTALYANTAVGAIPFFKNGGIVPHAAGGYRVPGNDYADMTPIMVSSGELILNKAQQGNLLSQMQQARDSDHGEIVARLSGEDILLVANRHLRRTGKGELVTWKS